SSSQKYQHRGKTFEIYNAGDVEVHPFEQYLSITVDNVAKGYRLLNKTTGEVFEYKGDSTGKLLLNGPNITLNGLQALRDTNKQYITLAKGWNTFRQNQSRKVEFDFRYYYK